VGCRARCAHGGPGHDVGQGSTADLPIQDRRLGPRLGTSRHRLLPAPMLRGTSGRFWSLIAVCWWIMGVNRGLASRRPRLKPAARLHWRPRATTCHLEPVFDSVPPKLRDLARSGSTSPAPVDDARSRPTRYNPRGYDMSVIVPGSETEGARPSTRTRHWRTARTKVVACRAGWENRWTPTTRLR